MKLNIYAATHKEDYLRAFYQLEREGKLQIKQYGRTPLRYCWRKLRGKESPSLRFICKSFIAPCMLLTTKSPILISNPPYAKGIILPALYTLCKKRIIYFNSWPYWDKKSYVIKPNYFTHKLWTYVLSKATVLTTTKTGQEALRKYTKNPQWVPHPVNTNLFKPAKKTTKKLTFACITGRLVKEKGVLDILEVAKQFPEIQFTFIGKGPLEKSIKKVTNANCTGYLNREQTAKQLQQADAFILNSYKVPGWEELFGIAVIEAMATGLPVIATDCVGPKEILKEIGIIIPQKDKKALAHAIKRLKDSKLRKALGAKGRKKAMTEYDIKKVSKKLGEVLK